MNSILSTLPEPKKDMQIRKTAFAKLGQRLAALPADQSADWQARAQYENPWFTADSVKLAISGIATMLDAGALDEWLNRYRFTETEPRTVGVVMAGNIPAVGFHDLMCVLLSGHTLHAKLSSQDTVLVKNLAALLTEIEPSFAGRIRFVERLTDADAFIATGSDNSARYFKQYFGHKPHIIRQNRTSCAVLTGQETAEELLALGRDITQYFGLGCRNVSKLFVPHGFDFVRLLDAFAPLGGIGDHHKYANNYQYQRAVHLVNQVPHYDNGFLLLTENDALTAPMAVVYYEYYADKTTLAERLKSSADRIQCVVSREGWWPSSVAFGQAQCPSVQDYADGVDTMQFLLSLA